MVVPHAAAGLWGLLRVMIHIIGTGAHRQEIHACRRSAEGRRRIVAEIVRVLKGEHGPGGPAPRAAGAPPASSGAPFLPRPGAAPPAKARASPPRASARALTLMHSPGWDARAACMVAVQPALRVRRACVVHACTELAGAPAPPRVDAPRGRLSRARVCTAGPRVCGPGGLAAACDRARRGGPRRPRRRRARAERRGGARHARGRRGRRAHRRAQAGRPGPPQGARLLYPTLHPACQPVCSRPGGAAGRAPQLRLSWPALPDPGHGRTLHGSERAVTRTAAFVLCIGRGCEPGVRAGRRSRHVRRAASRHVRASLWVQLRGQEQDCARNKDWRLTRRRACHPLGCPAALHSPGS